MIFYQSNRRYLPSPSVFSVHLPCSIFPWIWTKSVFSLRKCKHLAYMVIICRDIGCFMLALFYLENVMGDMQYKMWFSIRVREGTPYPWGVFLYTPLFNSSLCSWTEIVSSVRKCKNLASMVIFSRDIGCFMLALFYIEIWCVIFNIKCDFLSEWEEVSPHSSDFLYTSPFQFFSRVELKLIVSSVSKCN